MGALLPRRCGNDLSCLKRSASKQLCPVRSWCSPGAEKTRLRSSQHVFTSSATACRSRCWHSFQKAHMAPMLPAGADAAMVTVGMYTGNGLTGDDWTVQYEFTNTVGPSFYQVDDFARVRRMRACSSLASFLSCPCRLSTPLLLPAAARTGGSRAVSLASRKDAASASQMNSLFRLAIPHRHHPVCSLPQVPGLPFVLDDKTRSVLFTADPSIAG